MDNNSNGGAAGSLKVSANVLVSIAETAAFFHLTEKHMRLIEERSLAKLRAGMNDGKIL